MRLALRVLRIAIVALLSAWLLYVAAINAFLGTPLFQAVLGQDPVTIDIRYRWAWSLWPSTIHAEGLSIRSSDNNVEWNLDFDEVTFDMSFPALFERRFEVTRARGRGIVMHARQKLDRAPASETEVATLAPVRGFPAWSLRPAGPPSPHRWDDAQYKLFTVRLEDCIAEDVREVWVDDHRFVGNARIAGRFYLKPIRAVEIGPVHADLRDIAFHQGEARMLVEHVTGDMDVTFDRFDPRFLPGESVINALNVRSVLRASVPDLSALPVARLSGQADGREVRVNIAHGRIAEGTKVDVLATKVRRAPFGGVDHVTVVASVDDARKLDATVDAQKVDVAFARVGRVLAKVDATTLDLGNDPFSDLHAAVEATDAHVNARSVGLKGLEGGLVTGQLRGEVWQAEERFAIHAAELRATGVDARISRMRIRGNGSVTGKGGFNWGTKIASNVQLDVEANHTRVDLDDRFVGSVGRVDVDAHADKLAFDDPKLENIDARIAVRQVGIADLRSLRPILPPEGPQLQSGGARMSGEVRLSRGKIRGAAGIDILRGEVAIDQTVIQGDYFIRAAFRGTKDVLDISGTKVDLVNAVITTSSDADLRKPWKGTLALERATLRPGPPALDAVLKLDADNARPILGVLTQDSLPGIVKDAGEMPRLAAYARVRLNPDGFVISDISASGGTVAIKGIYGLYDDDRKGAFVVEKGPLSVGIELDRDSVKAHFFDLSSWLAKETRKVKRER